MAGVIAGIAARTGIDVVALRIAFVIAAVASGGLVLLAYVVAWVALTPADGPSTRAAGPVRLPSVRGGWRAATGVALLTLSALLAFRELGIWWSDALVWPLVLAAFGAAALWQRSRATGIEAESVPPAPRAPSRVADLYRGVFGVLLVIGAALLFLSSNHILGGLRDAALTAVVVVVALSLILAPFLWRLGRNLAVERAERIRSQERAELAAHLHDSVLQTLTLMQKRAGDPREVAALARRQERELREWLAGDGNRTTEGSFAATLRAAAEEVEDTAIETFVRDRGPGFELAAVPRDRRGVRESIVGRMERAGGQAEVRSIPGGGTEVGLSISRDQAAGERERR